MSKKERIITCKKCGDKFKESTGRTTEKSEKGWCGYCEVTMFGVDGEFSNWPPEISKTESREIRGNGHTFKLDNEDSEE